MTDWPPLVIKFAQAVSKAEGFGIPGAIPTVANNPCDLTAGDAGSFETDGTANAEGVVKFVRLEDGWSAAYIKFNRIFAGKSAVYPLSLTLAEMGLKYSGGDPNWSKNVASELGVLETTSLQVIAGRFQ